LQTERLGDGDDNQDRITDRSKHGEDDTIREVRLDPFRRGEGKTRLACATRARQREETNRGLVEERTHGCDLCLSTDE
jgi:hypothetical protein